MSPKVLPRRELARRSCALRREGRSLVLTNGCFDLLHAGHVRYLRRARALGDALVVGLNSDRSVRRLKGSGRPITPENDRAEILAALDAVTFVTVFDEDTALELVDAVRPTVYVKGGDYPADPGDPRFPVEGRLVLGYGGLVEIVPFLPGRSTTNILRRLSALERPLE